MPLLHRLTEHRQFKMNYQTTLGDHGKALAAYYYTKVPNWGDALNQYLLEKISGAPVVLCKSRRRQHIVGVGSIVNKANANSIVWGAGLAKPEHIRKASPGKVNSVRGPLTRQLLQQRGIYCPPVYGDPFIDDLVQCEVIASSSLHALTAAQIIASCRSKSICPSVEEKLLAAFPREVVERG